MITIKLIHHGFHTTYISPFIGRVPLGIYRKRIIPLLQSKQVLEQLLYSPPGLGTTSRVSGSCIDICICLVVSCGSYINPKVFFHAAIFKSKETAPKLVTLTIILVNVFEEADDIDSQNEITPSRYCPLVSVVSSFCPLPTWTNSLVTRGCRHGVCCPSISFPARVLNEKHRFYYFFLASKITLYMYI